MLEAAAQALSSLTNESLFGTLSSFLTLLIFTSAHFRRAQIRALAALKYAH